MLLSSVLLMHPLVDASAMTCLGMMGLIKLARLVSPLVTPVSILTIALPATPLAIGCSTQQLISLESPVPFAFVYIAITLLHLTKIASLVTIPAKSAQAALEATAFYAIPKPNVF